MSDNVIRFQGKTLKSQAKMAINENPDVVYDTVTKFIIKREDFEFWSNFLTGFGAAIPQLYEKDKKAYKDGKISNEDFEFSKKSHELSMTAFARALSDLKTHEENESGDFIYNLNSIDCYFVPAFLEDYYLVYPLEKEKCELYITVFLHALNHSGSAESVEERIDAIAELVGEFIDQYETVYFE